MRSLKIAISLVALAGLAGCTTTGNKPATVQGACESFPRPQYAYKGKAKQDQLYIDKSIAAGVNGCGYARPEPRPKTWDGPTHTVANKTVPVPIPVSGKDPFWKRFRGQR